MTTPIESSVLEITRIFEASPTEVFNAWLDREQWASWIGPEGVSHWHEIPERRIDERFHRMTYLKRVRLIVIP